MFSGGVVSSNLRSFDNSNSKGIAKKQKRFSKPRTKSAPKAAKEHFINWQGDSEDENNANLRSTYAVQINQNIRLVSPGGFTLLVGLAVVLVGCLLTLVAEMILYGGIAIGTGLYISLIAICWLLDDRDNGCKLFVFKDIYSEHAVKRPK